MPYVNFVVNEVLTALVKRLANVWRESGQNMQDAIQEEEKLVGEVAAYFTTGKGAAHGGPNPKKLLKACDTFIANGRKNKVFF